MISTEFLVLIFFVYGLAFFGMGIAMALESGRATPLVKANSLRPLAVFGVLHGTHEWLESYLLQAEWAGTSLPAWLIWLRLGLLIASFLFLGMFAFSVLRLSDSIPNRLYLIGSMSLFIYAVIILGGGVKPFSQGSIPIPVFIDALTRYLLAVPASILSAVGLVVRSRKASTEGAPRLKWTFSLAALGFMLYASTQLFVQPMAVFPANIINQQSFASLTGFPIQLIRALTALLISYPLLRAAQLMEHERNFQLATVQRGRLEAMQAREILKRNLLRECVKAQEDERARVARELHDDTAQSLSALSIELATLQQLVKGQKTPTEKVRSLQELCRQTSQGLLRLMSDLRPSQLDELGLIPAIKFFVEQECSLNGMKIVLEPSGQTRRLDPRVENVLFRVVQEAVHNIERHAGTPAGQILLNYKKSVVELQIIDKGSGFDVNHSFTAPHGWGVAGMRERVESAGGQFFLNSTKGRGTTVRAVIPLNGRH
jgi:two-component system sensor histidine kinase UhpB